MDVGTIGDTRVPVSEMDSGIVKECNMMENLVGGSEAKKGRARHLPLSAEHHDKPSPGS